MRICKPNEGELIYGQGSPSMMGMNWAGFTYTPPAPTSAPIPATTETIAQVVPSVPSSPGTFAVSPGVPQPATVDWGIGQVTITSTWGGTNVGPGPDSATNASSAGAVNGHDSMSDSYGGSGPGGW